MFFEILVLKSVMVVVEVIMTIIFGHSTVFSVVNAEIFVEMKYREVLGKCFLIN